MAVNPIQLQDCHLIVKTYEKGCHASITEGSVFAPMSANLDFIRSMCSTISNQMAAAEPSEDNKVDLKALDKGPIGVLLSAEASDLADSFGGIFDSECIPCLDRLKLRGELSAKVGLSDIGKQLLALFEGWLQRALSQIKNLIDMFSNLDRYVDVCSFFKFFKDFVCIPDLARILAILMAMMIDISFELNFMIDLVLSLVAPLLMPFLSNLMDTLIKYLLTIIKPIECIIDSIQNLLGKLDYNVLFKDVERLNFKLPTISATFSLGPQQKAQVAKEQAEVDQTKKTLDRIKVASNKVEIGDTKAYEEYRKQEAKAVEAYRNALKERSLSEIGQANLNIEKFQTQFKSMFLTLVTVLREAAAKIDSYIRELFDELKRLMLKFGGGSGLYIDFGQKKLIIVQLIALIKTLIKFFKGKIECDDDKQEIEAFTNMLSKESGFKVWKDEKGDLYISEKFDGINELAVALGNSSGVYLKDDDLSGDKGLRNLGSLIEYTGDKTLDTELSETVEKLIKPKSVKLTCSAQTSVSNAEQVNQWIQEIGNE